MKALLYIAILAGIVLSTNIYAKKFLRVEAGAHTASITSLHVTADSRYLVTTGNDKTIRVWDIETGKESRKILGFIGTGPDGMIHATALSPDNKYLAVAVHRGETYNKPNTNGDTKDVIRLYDFQKGKIIKVIKPENGDDILSVNFSDNGKFLISGSEDHSITVWDLPTLINDQSAEPYQIIRDEDNIMRPYSVAMITSDEDNIVVSADFAKSSIIRYSLKQKKVLKPYYKDTNRLQYFAISNQHIAVSGYENHILIFDLELNFKQEIKTENNPTGLAFSPNGKLLLAGSKETTDNHPLGNNIYKLDDAEEKFTKLTTYTQHDSNVVAVGFLNDQTAITAGGNGNEIHFWDVSTLQQKKIIRGQGKTIFAVGLKDQQIAFGHTQNYKKDANNYARLENSFDLTEFEAHMDAPKEELASFIRAQPNWKNQKAFVEPRQPWNLLINKNNYDYSAYRQGWYYHETYGFSDQGYLLSGGRGSEVRAYKLDGNSSYARLQTDFIGHSGRVWDLASKDNLLVTGGVDQTIKLWNLNDIKDGKTSAYAMLNLFVSTSGEWIIWSKNGYYDASLNGDKFIGYHVNQGEDEAASFYSSDRFLKTLYRPDIIRKILETGSEELALQSTDIQPRQIDMILPPKIELVGTQSLNSDGQLVLNFVVTPAEDNVTRISILHNGQFVWENDSSAIENGGKFSEKMEVIPGENKFEIYAESHVSRSNATKVIMSVEENEWQARGRTSVSESVKMIQEEPNLYILAIGVSKYKNKGPNLENLNFAHVDATDVIKAFQNQQGKAYKKVVSKLLINNEADKKAIENGFDWLKSEVNKRTAYKKANGIISDDITLVFIAGHGVKYGEEFIFLGHDADPNNVEPTGVNLMAQGRVITALPTQVMLITDACHSGTIGGGIFKNIDSRELSKRLVALNERTLFILNATKKDKPSLEKMSLGHGVFTKVLLEGLKDDQKVYIHPLLSFIQRNVRKLTLRAPGGVQEPHILTYGEFKDYLIHSK